MVKVFLQEACLRHQFIRSKDTTNVVERPERLRAVNIGIATAMARLNASQGARPQETKEEPADELASAIGKLNIGGSSSVDDPITIVKSSAQSQLLNNAAIKYIHGDIEGDVYLEKLIKLAKDSRNNITELGSEIPDGLSQGDLYLCPESISAIQGALGTICEAVDAVLEPYSPSRNAFVAIRPPGHHCGEDTPSGFCFVNNVAVAAAHAHLKHNINRVVIFDIDLHHGNGTQSLVWQINEESYRVALEQASGAPPTKPGLQVFYGSIHDILSFPCEDGKIELVQAASTAIRGPHGQYIENIHLEPYTTDEHFWGDLYPNKYSKLLDRAEAFIRETGGIKADALVFISCGFDACEHEYPSMSRHGRKVPVAFYHRFAQDVQKFADKVSRGRLISVLEGGYSDRALTSGAMAHVAGLAENDNVKANPDWWKLDNLTTLEKATKKRRGGRASGTAPPEPWVERTLECLAQIDSAPPPVQVVVAPLAMALRERTKPTTAPTPALVPASKPKKGPGKAKAKQTAVGLEESASMPTLRDTITVEQPQSQTHETSKKLPRVILKLGPGPDKEAKP